MSTCLGHRGRTWPVACVAIAVTACSGGAPDRSASGTTAPSSDGTAAAVAASAELLLEVVAEDEPGCSAAVGVDGDVVWTGARGVADVDTGARLDTSTTFDVGSVTKQFTATAVLLLALEERLGLEDPVARWVPGLPAWSREVRLEQLIEHTSGIPDFIEPMQAAGFDLSDRATQQDTLEVIADLEPIAPPGERAEYSNSGYVLLAEVIRAASGRSLPDFLRERVFDPLELDMVIDPAPSSPDETDPSTARGHLRDDTGRGWEPTGSRWEMAGPGFLQTTPSELVRWADNYRSGEVGHEALLEAQVADPFVVRPGLASAAGIFVVDDGSLRHGGSWAGQLADFLVSPDRHTAIAVACNYDTGSTSDIDHIANNLRHEWFD